MDWGSEMARGTIGFFRGAIIAGLLLVFCHSTAAAAADPPPFLWQIPSSMTPGAGAGEIGNPRGIATDPETGHVYIADSINRRINEFDAWGVFVKAWGWGVRTGSSELEVCTATTGCQQGILGDGPGQLGTPMGIAVDDAGDIYVYERTNLRVSKFSSSGAFLLTFGGQVNKTTGGNVCTAASADQCGIGVLGTDAGEFSNESVGTYLTASPDGTIWVGDVNRLQQFESTGLYKSQIATPEPGTSGSLAADPASGDLYFDFAQGINPPARPNVYRLNASNGEVVDELPVSVPKVLSVSGDGKVYVVDDPFGFGPVATEPFIRVFDAAGQQVLGEETAFERPSDSTVLTALGTSSACNVPEPVLYVAHFGGSKTYVRAFGPHPRDPEDCPPPQAAPTIENQYVLSATATAALLRAELNPHFWADTTYYVEYGLAPCSTGGCSQKQPVPSAMLTSEVVDDSIHTAAVPLSGLIPNRKYHFRFVAESGGGGPVYGLDPDGAGPNEGTPELGLEGTFFTFPESKQPSGDSCPNASHRIGLGAHLPNCRAYELVSPADKNGSDVSVLFNARNKLAELNQGSRDGNRISFSAQTSFGDARSAPYTSQYLASRQEGVAWSTHGISPPRETESVAFFQPPRLDVQFKAFSDDLCESWLLQDTDPPLAPGGVPGYLNLYQRQNCAAESYEAITSSEPEETTAETYWPELQGTSADGSHVVFRANAKLTGNASDAKEGDDPIYQLYEHYDGGLRLVSVLPGEVTSDSPSSAGTPSVQLPENRSNNVWHAVSADGSKIFWSTSKTGPGPLYVRVDGVSTTAVSTTPAHFLGAAADGSRAIFLREGGLYEFTVATAQTTLIADGAKGVMGMSEDASKVYLVSSEELEDEGIAGEPNLYLYERGLGMTYIATLSDADARTDTGPISSPINPEPMKRTARVTPDGGTAVFVSSARLTGYDNRDAESGEPDSEVFVYDADSADLVCVSCNPTGARPSGRDVFPSEEIEHWVAARIVPWASQHYAPRALSGDGTRVFFESFEALVPRDANGRQDVYQWEQIGSHQECEQSGGELFVEDAAGCLSLISPGTSSIDAQFVDASADGRDVFFKTSESLLPQDPGLVDIYDAREGGGLPVPPPPRPDCQPESNCQSPPPNPPAAVSPRSAVFTGPGNPKGKKPCPKGKRRVVRKGKSRCVPRKHRQHRRGRHKRQAQSKGGSGR